MILDALHRIANHRQSLSRVEARAVMSEVLTGKCTDIGRFKTSSLRGLASRPPYFHDGQSATLMDVVNFYNDRFQVGLTTEEKEDLVAFLRTL